MPTKNQVDPPRFYLRTLREEYHRLWNLEQGNMGGGLIMWPVRSVAGYGCVPMSATSCKSYILYTTKKFDTWDSKYRWDDNTKEWKVTVEKENFETFDATFKEDFYFFLRKNDYYFVTESGKLYHAPPPAKGEKSRTMKALWTDAKRPIVAVLEDADRDKVFLFAKDKTAGAKEDVFFELNQTLRPQSFDRSKLASVDVAGRAKVLLEYLPLISAGDKK